MLDNTQAAIKHDVAQQLDVIVSDDNIANINISFDINELIPYQKKFIEEKRKNIILRGFRKGTAPENMVAKFFATEARETAKNNVLYTKYNQLLQDHKLQSLTQPKLEKFSEVDNKIFAVFSVEVLQPIVLAQYLGLEVQKIPAHTVENTLIKTLHDIKHAYPKLIETDETAQDGRVVIVSFIMSVDNQEVERQDELKVLLGSKLYYQDFETNMIGLKAHDSKEFDMQLPETYQNELYRNKQAHFNLTVKSIHDVAEYSDEELAGILKYENKDIMLSSISKEIEDKRKEDEFVFYENQILGQLLAAHAFTIPKILIDNEIAKIMIEKPDTTKEQACDIAERFVRTDLILHAIYERHPDIHLTQEVFNKKLEDLAVKAKDSVENIAQKLQSTGKMQSYFNYLRNCKVIEFLIEMADIKELQADMTMADVAPVAEETTIKTEEK